MSRFEIKMPKLGESITEGTIISWSVQVGDIKFYLRKEIP